MTFDREIILERPFDPSSGGYVSPADRPPTYGLPIPWAHFSFGPGEYQERLRELRDLMRDMSLIAPIPRNQFSVLTFTGILVSLYHSFKITDQPVDSLNELTHHHIAGPRLHRLLDAGAFSPMSPNPSSRKPFTRMEEVLSIPPEEIFFDTLLYQALPDFMKDYLIGINLLLVQDRYNRYRVSATLVPCNPGTPIDGRYLDFYRGLTGRRIASFFTIKGPYSTPDSILGIFDSTVVNAPNAAKPLFPQYDSAVSKYGEAVSDIRQMRIENFSTDADSGWAEVVDISSGTHIRFGLENNVVQVFIDGERSEPHNKTKIASLLRKIAIGLQTKEQSETIDVDINIFRETKDFYQLETERQMAASVYDRSGKLDINATTVYHDIVNRLSRGAINFRFVQALIAQVQDKLSSQQLDFISLGLANYTFNTISRGQLADLEGMDDVMILLLRNFELYPEIANRLLFFAQSLSPGTASNIVTGLSRDGVVHTMVNILALQSDKDGYTKDSLLSEPRSVSYLSRQARMMTRLLEYTQQELPGIEVDEEIVQEIIKYGPIIQIMQGRNVFFDEGRLTSKLVASLVIFFEAMVGIELPELRKAIPFDARQQLTQAKQDLLPKLLS